MSSRSSRPCVPQLLVTAVLVSLTASSNAFSTRKHGVAAPSLRVGSPPGRSVSTVLSSSTAYSVPLEGLDENSTRVFVVPAPDAVSAGVAPQVKESTTDSSPLATKESRKQLIRSEGGRFVIDTKYGALNAYGLFYGLTSIFLGIPWFFALTLYQFFTLVTGGIFDKQRRIPVMLNQLWGTTLMSLTGNWPKYERLDILKRFYKL
jgi:hypothetical protein